MFPRRTAALGAVLLAAAVPTRALDPQRATSQYVITKWGAGTLPSNTIHSLLQTRDRYLWLGTTTGLVRFDGTSFAVFSARNTPSIGESGAYRLAEGKDGALFVGTSSGMVLRYQAGEFSRLFVPPGTAYVTALHAARDGSVWIGMHGQVIHRWAAGQVTELRRRNTIQAPYAMVEDGRGGILIASRTGLVRFADEKFEPVNVTSDVVQALMIDGQGTLWLGTPHGLLRVREGRVEQRFTVRDGLSHDNVTAILEDRDGNLWIGTAGGLSRYRDGRWSRLTTLQGLSDDDVRSLLEDHEGNLWVGTADGLNSVSNGRFVTYGRHEGLQDSAVQCVIGASDGSVWMGTASGTVARLERGGSIRHYALPSAVGREAVISMAETRDGSIWIGLDNGRVFQLKDGRVRDRTPDHTPSTSKILFAYEDEEGPVFYMRRGSAGFFRLVGREAVPAMPSIRGSRYFHHASRDEHGRFWIGDLAGLWRVENDRWTLYTTVHGLPQNRVRWLSLEPGGGAWVATIGGLGWFKDGKIHPITAQHGLPENYLRFIQDDGLGHLWVASMGYIFRLSKSELMDFIAGKVSRVSPLLFDTTDGLRTTEGLLSNSPGFRGPDGRLWFATGKGVSVVDPAAVVTVETAPPVTIADITVDGRHEAAQEYPHGRGETAVTFTALGFRAPGKIRFRYRLLGLDADWIDAGTQRRAYYSSLPAGRYTFSVMASNADGVWNGRPTEVSFTIQRAFTGTPLFYALVAAGLAAAAGLVYRVRVGDMHARYAAIIGERTRIARELHDTLAQGLAAVAFQIETAVDSLEESTQAARAHMQLADTMVRSSLAEVRRSIWVLRAQTSRATSGLGESLSSSLSQITAESDVESRIAVTGRPRPLAIEVERNLLRIAHEAVTNAVRHAEARSISVDVQFEEEGVRLRVKDDGRGFDADDKARRRGDHFGLLGIQERARALGGELELTTAPGRGTEIVCRLPYHSRVDPGEAATEDTEGIGL